MATRRRRKRTAQRLKILIGLLSVVLVAVLIVAITMSGDQDDDPTLNSDSPTETQTPTQNPTQSTPTTQPSAPTDPPPTGWVELDGRQYYYGDDSVLRTGAQEIDGAIYCFGADGALCAEGWQDIGDDRYYVTAGGTAHIGWLELESNLYYLQTDGTMARGQLDIDGETWFFTSAGCQIYVVNPWHSVPEGYAPELVAVSSAISKADTRVDACCYDALIRMMSDCADAGHNVYITSSYRTHEYQTYLYNRKVNYYIDTFGYSLEDAQREAATVSAIPGTSEHQLGLAVDIIDTQIWDLVEEQENLAGQQWLMEHCWEYGFILRYPKGATDVTGIIYEPWHYRYVGPELAAELHQLGITLEEYIANLTE